MKSLRIFNRRAGSVFAAAALVLATTVPAMVSAATVTGRSISLSSSVKSATSNYRVQFTTPSATSSTGAFVVDFCSDPNVGAACTPAGGTFSTNGVGTSGGNTATAINSDKGVKVELGTPVSGGGNVDVTLTGIVNPTATGVFYARVVTYEDGTTNYNYTNPTTLGTHLDEGGVALSITDGFGVSGRVLETMVFCASGSSISTDCGGSLTQPNLSLGASGILSTTLSTGTVYTQLSTNAVGGAVVNLKSDTAGCGGLVRQGATTNALGCGIAPVSGSAAAINTGDAKFGLKLASLTATTGTIAASGSYNTTNYFMGWVNGDASGVTGPYGDAIYNTSGAPVNNGSANLTFGANMSNVTPAGNYSASLNLIATGTF